MRKKVSLEGDRVVKIEEVKKVEPGSGEKGLMVIARLGNEDMRRKILRNKWRLKGKEIWIEDLTKKRK